MQYEGARLELLPANALSGSVSDEDAMIQRPGTLGVNGNQR